jgi:hypothetical protein
MIGSARGLVIALGLGTSSIIQQKSLSASGGLAFLLWG